MAEYAIFEKSILSEAAVTHWRNGENRGIRGEKKKERKKKRTNAHESTFYFWLVYTVSTISSSGVQPCLQKSQRWKITSASRVEMLRSFFSSAAWVYFRSLSARHCIFEIPESAFELVETSKRSYLDLFSTLQVDRFISVRTDCPLVWKREENFLFTDVVLLTSFLTILSWFSKYKGSEKGEEKWVGREKSRNK